MKNNTDSERYTQRVLQDLDNIIAENSFINENFLEIPSWKIRIQPEVTQVKERMAVIDFYLECPKWDRMIYECSAALAGDQYDAIGMAVGGFLFGVYDGIEKMITDKNSEQLVTSFQGKQHKWSVYMSNVVGMGDCPSIEDTNFYWEMLKSDIIKRLGNQKLCYIKIFASKMGDKITGECRINDIKSEELSHKIAEQTETWDNEEFGSIKQFILLYQDDSTYTPYPYTQEQINKFVLDAVELFAKQKTEEEDETYIDRLTDIIQDRSLAEELKNFLPELCADYAFDEASIGEAFVIVQDGTENNVVYAQQIYSYHMIQNALYTAFDKEQISNEVYKQYVMYSATAGCIQQAMEKEANLKDIVLSLAFFFSDNYEFR